MQRFILCLLVLILTAAPVWAALNPIHPINKSPYVSALVSDADTGNVLVEDNADARVYPASVLKLMDLYVILDRIEQGALKLDEMVPVTTEAYKTGGSQVGRSSVIVMSTAYQQSFGGLEAVTYPTQPGVAASGQVWVLTGQTVTQGSWSRGADTATFQMNDLNGRPIGLQRGPIYVGLVTTAPTVT